MIANSQIAQDAIRTFTVDYWSGNNYNRHLVFNIFLPPESSVQFHFTMDYLQLVW